MSKLDLRELEFEAVPFGECRPPFTPGQRIYQIGRPESGSLAVARCKPYPDGGWSVTAFDHYYPGVAPISITAPAEHFRACGTKWTEPPVCPIESVGYDATGEVRWRELQEDPEYAARIAAWREAVAARAVALDAMAENE